MKVEVTVEIREGSFLGECKKEEKPEESAFETKMKVREEVVKMRISRAKTRICFLEVC